MSLDYYGLPLEQQQYLAQRFGAYGLDPELAYNTLLPDAVKNQGPEAIEEFMRHKDISHIYPQSQYPHLSGDLNNVFLEDPYVNAARGDQIATQDEVWQAHQDNLSDAWDGDFNDNGLLDSWEFLF